jgi:superfamily II DNA/RNA helicase
MNTAYRIKLFMNKFHLKAFVLATDMPRSQHKTVVNLFNLGQYDILIMLHSGYSIRPEGLKQV